MKDDCIFCKLANGIIPTNSIYEDDEFKVILDAGPAAKGHSLILPKEHYANIYELPDDIAGQTCGTDVNKSPSDERGGTDDAAVQEGTVKNIREAIDILF